MNKKDKILLHITGYNRQGYDKNGYNRYGYDKNGFNKNGEYNPKHDKRKNKKV